jgi:hypothetical protein
MKVGSDMGSLYRAIKNPDPSGQIIFGPANVAVDGFAIFNLSFL